MAFGVLTKLQSWMRRRGAHARVPAVFYTLPFAILETLMRRHVVTPGEAYDELYYRINHMEYVAYGFRGKSQEAKRDYLSVQDRFALMDRLNAKNGANILLDNKYLTYSALRPFFRREALLIGTADDEVSFAGFLSAHQKAFVKPLNKNHGDGVQLIRSNCDVSALFHEMINEGPFLLEEAIEQDKAMSAFHPASVNTIRMVTHYNKKEDRCTVVFALLRMGVNGSIVDNSSAGGIIANIDIARGVVNTPGFRRNLERHATHPDSGYSIINAEIPHWNDLIAFAESLVRKLPYIPLIGWDFALSNKGWCIVESNQKPSFLSVQVLQERGIRPLIEPLLRDGAQEMID